MGSDCLPKALDIKLAFVMRNKVNSLRDPNSYFMLNKRLVGHVKT